MKNLFKMKNITYHIILALFLVSLISSIVLSTQSISEVCEVGSVWNCEIIYASGYNSFLGIQNSYYGVVIFTLLILLTLSHLINPSQNKKALINLSIIGGSLIALYFLYLQHFVLQAYCKYCLIVDFSILICLALIVPELKKGFKSLKLQTKNEEDIAAGS